MKAIITLIFILFYQTVYSANFDNITGNTKANVNARKKIIEPGKNPGIRLAWDGMKHMNKVLGTGDVDIAVKKYEIELKDRIEKMFEQKNPGYRVTITKTDFKGYYLTCTPAECLDKLERFSDSFPKSTVTKNGVTHEFGHVKARANHYQEGYVKARVMGEYLEGRKKELSAEQYNKLRDQINRDLGGFLDQELKDALKAATGVSDLRKIQAQDPDFMQKLAAGIEKVRAEDAADVDPAMKRLITALDMLETPFASSNNLDQDLEDAMKIQKEMRTGEKFTVQSAISGDDLFMVIKDSDGKVVKIVGADAKGLGVLNMTERYKEYVGHLSGGKNRSISDLEKVYSLSLQAMNNADDKMGRSISQYESRITQAIQGERVTPANIDKFIDEAHRGFYADTLTNPDLMNMRTAAITSCPDTKCVKNSITDIHNLLKEMEKRGYNGHFGDSCLGVQYLMHKFKIPKSKSN